MRIAIIGGGFTGLTAAYALTKRGYEVTVFEKEKVLGGLVYGFKGNPPAGGWDWHLEGAYHHLFTNDHAILSLLDELGLQNKVIVKHPITATLMPTGYGAGNKRREAPVPEIYQLDSPMNLLTFPFLSPFDKVRTAALLAFLKINPFWQPLENLTAQNFFKTIGGVHAWDVLWEPLMRGKFGTFSKAVAASWLAARIKKRTSSLCYIEGGFQTLVVALADAIKTQGGTIKTNTTIKNIANFKNFDAVLLTVPTPIAAKLVRFPRSYLKSIHSIPHLHAQTLILETKQPILKDVYWLNINDRSFPFLAAVAHTNFMSSKHYGNHHLTYFGNYLPQGHPYLSMNKKELLKVFLPFIKRLNPDFSIVGSFLFVGPFAQPVHQLHYSKTAPTIQTPIPNVYLANLDSIYPWDRGTNYAVELGQKAAKIITKGVGAKKNVPSVGDSSPAQQTIPHQRYVSF